MQLTRRILELVKICGHPLTIVTKSALVERDLDLLLEMAQQRQTQVMISFSTLKRDLARKFEPRAAAPQRRLETIRRLSDAGIPVGVLLAPVIPALTDLQLEQIMQAVRDNGAVSVSYVLLRLPLEVAPLFSDWLEIHVPDQAQRVLQRFCQTIGGFPPTGAILSHQSCRIASRLTTI